jgi:hypothetical protein
VKRGTRSVGRGQNALFADQFSGEKSIATN